MQQRRVDSAGQRLAGAHLPYLPGLDGLRAVAVVAVLLYHADLLWIPGGFLGVEVFFVLSGYLITALLLAEWRQQGYINLTTFWVRRARRLLPALYLLLAVTLTFAVVVLPDEVAGLRHDVLAALGYVTNWYLVLGHEPYFETVGRPSLLQHLWSLAVEEQFYLVWPLLLSAGLQRWPAPRVWHAVLVGGLTAAALMAICYQPDVDPSRLYYGTDTRASGLLAGAALAFVRRPEELRLRIGEPARLLFDLAGLGALGALLWCFHRLDAYQPLLYRGGFALVASLTVLVIAIAVDPRSRLIPKLLEWWPLRWIGLRSYSIYLWHWPVFMITRPQLDVPVDELSLLPVRLAITILLAELSYLYVETPIRHGAIGRAWSALRRARGRERRRLHLRWSGTLMAAATLVVLLGRAVVEARPPVAPSYLSIDAVDIRAADINDTARPAATPIARAQSTPPSPDATPVSFLPVVGGATPSSSPQPAPPATATPLPPSTATALPAPAAATEPQLAATAPPPTATVPPPTATAPAPTATTQPLETATALQPTPAIESGGLSPATTPIPVAAPSATASPPAAAQASDTQVRSIRVTAVGDSVMLGAARELLRNVDEIQVNAAIKRQAKAAIAILREQRAAGQLGEVVVVHLGNNGVVSTRQFDELMQVLADVHLVVVVNSKTPRPWQAANNRVLEVGVQRYPNAVLVDWYAASAGRPELFWKDGIHLRPAGARFYASLIAAQVQASIGGGAGGTDGTD